MSLLGRLSEPLKAAVTEWWDTQQDGSRGGHAVFSNVSLYFQLLRRDCFPGVIFLDGVYNWWILRSSFAGELCPVRPGPSSWLSPWLCRLPCCPQLGRLASASLILQQHGLLHTWKVAANNLRHLHPAHRAHGDSAGLGTARKGMRAELGSAKNSKEKGEGDRGRKRSWQIHSVLPSLTSSVHGIQRCFGETRDLCGLFLFNYGRHSNGTFAFTLPPFPTHIHFSVLLAPLGIMLLQKSISS